MQIIQSKAYVIATYVINWALWWTESYQKVVVINWVLPEGYFDNWATVKNWVLPEGLSGKLSLTRRF